MATISHSLSKLIKNMTFLAIIIGLNCFGKEKYQMENPAKTIIDLELATTKEQHQKGLSGRSSKSFKNTQGMLFVNQKESVLQFWMPDTYFNLDIIFLDSHLKIVGIEKNVPAHPGLLTPPDIYVTNKYLAQFVLETKAQSKFSLNLKKNDQLKFISSTSLFEIALKTHLAQ